MIYSYPNKVTLMTDAFIPSMAKRYFVGPDIADAFPNVAVQRSRNKLQCIRIYVNPSCFPPLFLSGLITFTGVCLVILPSPNLIHILCL